MGELSEGKDQSLVGSDPFALAENDVLKAIEETRKSVDGFRAGLEDENEKFKSFSQKALPKKEQELQALTRLSPEEILEKLKGLYDKVVELTNANLPREEIIARIRTEFPDFADYYTILRQEPWGYRLGQAIFAEKVESGS
ncbi:MAG: hypothetical protein HY433_03770 [Candidatus Liptonbacteria bacterium]|nr:hypothetical protein [Candidatus Liptonbacteria bacterium]